MTLYLDAPIRASAHPLKTLTFPTSQKAVRATRKGRFSQRFCGLARMSGSPFVRSHADPSETQRFCGLARMSGSTPETYREGRRGARRDPESPDLRLTRQAAD
jgi:hypothetical protein